MQHKYSKDMRVLKTCLAFLLALPALAIFNDSDAWGINLFGLAYIALCGYLLPKTKFGRELLDAESEEV